MIRYAAGADTPTFYPKTAPLSTPAPALDVPGKIRYTIEKTERSAQYAAAV